MFCVYSYIVFAGEAVKRVKPWCEAHNWGRARPAGPTGLRFALAQRASL